MPQPKERDPFWYIHAVAPLLVERSIARRAKFVAAALVKGIGRTMDAKVRQYQQYLSVISVIVS